jgi:hypothetical protein
MNNTGWFESQIKVLHWYGTGDSANYAAFFMEVDPQNTTDNVVGVYFYPDSTLLGYFSSGAGNDHHLVRKATNPALPLLLSNQWHQIRFFHNGTHWDFYFDTVLEWTGELVDVAQNQQLYEEWQFGPGNGTDPQTFWVDDWANPHGVPPVMADATLPQGNGVSFDLHRAALRK